MNSILIEAAHFSQAQALRELIARRMLDVGILGETVAPDAGATLVFSAAHEAALGNMQALLAVARGLKPRLVVIVDDSADQFSITSDLGGKVQRVNLPQSDGLALTVAADIICADLAKMIAADPATSDLLVLANRVAKSDVTVFINGPTGTGKEVLARFIHDRSDRAKEPFVAINCAAIPENMLEAVLFGHEKGAFTGASVANKGIFRAADKGTLLLDEISEMPLGLQSKLLRVLQERKVTPLGAQGEIDVNCARAGDHQSRYARRGGSQPLPRRFVLSSQCLSDGNSSVEQQTGGYSACGRGLVAQTLDVSGRASLAV